MIVCALLLSACSVQTAENSQASQSVNALETTNMQTETDALISADTQSGISVSYESEDEDASYSDSDSVHIQLNGKEPFR